MPRLATGALLGSVAFCLLGAGASVEATGPAVIRLTDVQSSTASSGRLGRPGGLEVIQQRLYGSSGKSIAIGRSVVTCLTITNPERRCDGSYALPRGTIFTGAMLDSRLFYTAAILGGTGLYDNARGTLTVTETRLRPRREILLFRLTG